MFSVNRVWRAGVALVLLAAGTVAGCQSQSTGSGMVTVARGTLAGTSDERVRAFRGIPFAAPPVGALRWRPPQPAPAWRGARDATEFGPACPQPMRRDRRAGIGKTSEDCLYLNVWAPVGATHAPVMVWIHGGAFRIGSSSQSIYDGASFARNGVILVSFDYRLGRLGFFAHPSLEVSGNFGLMDQLAALQWVQRNIAAFGGDPDNVTVFGESAGGSSVLYLLTSPRAKGLFSKAIVESGGGFQVTRYLDKRRDRRPSLMDEGLAWQGPEVSANALRALPVDTVIGASLGGGIASTGPVIDGDIVVGDPGKRLQAGEFNHVPVLVGSNSYEASVLAAFGTDAAKAVAASGVNVARLRALYTGDNWAARAWGDAAFVAGARLVARSVAAAGLPAYLYHFDYVLARRRGKVPGAGHGTEIPFVFNTLDQIPFSRVLITDEDRALASRLHSHWLSFARGGNPAGGVKGYWPAYTTDNDTLLYIGTTVEAQGGFRRRQLDFAQSLWEAR